MATPQSTPSSVQIIPNNHPHPPQLLRKPCSAHLLQKAHHRARAGRPVPPATESQLISGIIRIFPEKDQHPRGPIQAWKPHQPICLYSSNHLSKQTKLPTQGEQIQCVSSDAFWRKCTYTNTFFFCPALLLQLTSWAHANIDLMSRDVVVGHLLRNLSVRRMTSCCTLERAWHF